jgi:hypothetical protein
MLIFCTILWCLSGLISWIFAAIKIDQYLTIKTLVIGICICWLGLIISILVLLIVFGNKVIYKTKDYKD